MTDAPQRATTTITTRKLPHKPSAAEVLRGIERLIEQRTMKLRRDLAKERIARRAAR
jgi:hypothetical protein